MLHGTAGIVCAISAALGSELPPDAAAEQGPGQRWTYAGRLLPVGATGDESSARSFRIHYVLAHADSAASGRRVLWVLEELAGQPRWPWSGRFGAVPLNKSLAATSDRELPAIQAERDGMVRAIPLRLPPYGAAERLKADAEWDENKLHFRVVGREEIAGRRCWKVAASSNLGLRELDWVDEAAPLVVKHQEAVFLGQGVAHELTLELENAGMPADTELARVADSHARLAELRGPLRDKLSERPEVGRAATPESLEQARETLTKIQGELQSGPYVDLGKEMVREIQAELSRRSALEKLAAEIVGKPAQDFSLPTTRSGKVALADFKGKPLVLHFWEYRSEPKVAPYGETGYLDFVSRQREKQGVRVVGVAVDERFVRQRPAQGAADADAARAAARKDVRSFCEFMNLSYPVAFDEAKIIESFGDPRRVGAKLPLYIVIDPNGVVSEYHPGLWGTTADEGLKELDQQLLKLITQ